MELEEKRNNGELKRGRPVVEGSKRQVRLSIKGLVKLGRPVDVNSKSYLRKLELEEKRLNGTLKLGRPAKVE